MAHQKITLEEELMDVKDVQIEALEIMWILAFMNTYALSFHSFIPNFICSVDLIALLISEKCNVWRKYSTFRDY